MGINIEAMRLRAEDEEGYAIRLNGELAFSYHTLEDARCDATLDRDHADVLNIPDVMLTMYYLGQSHSDEHEELNVSERETSDPEEFYRWCSGRDI